MSHKLKDLDLKGKKVVMRVDFNVPADDDTRIREALPSIQYVLDQGGSVILMSHMGRPKGKDPKLSLKPVAARLEKLLNRKVQFVADCQGKEVQEAAKNLQPKEVLLLENLRFYPEEEKPEKNPEFAKFLASLGDVYVDDAFGCAHRAHTSIVKVAELFPEDKRAMGFLVEKEVDVLRGILKNPERPFYALVGGAKISSKIGVLMALIEKVDALFLGGAMVYTFMKAQGIDVGLSLVEEDQTAKALEIMEACKKAGVHLYLPVDIVAADKIAPDAQIEIVSYRGGMQAPFQGVDMGPKTIELYTKALADAKTVLWNGPFGVFEVPPFDKGTHAMAEVLSNLKAKVVVGGGDSVAAVQKAGLADKFAHVSTGGGACLEFLEFGTLPGIEVLK